MADRTTRRVKRRTRNTRTRERVKMVAKEALSSIQRASRVFKVDPMSHSLICRTQPAIRRQLLSNLLPKVVEERTTTTQVLTFKKVE
jgi:hypothetical protein